MGRYGIKKGRDTLRTQTDARTGGERRRRRPEDVGETGGRGDLGDGLLAGAGVFSSARALSRTSKTSGSASV